MRQKPLSEDQEFPVDLQKLFGAYKSALPDKDASANFMPELWGRIEAKRKVTYSFGRLTGIFVTASAALCIVFSAALLQHKDNVPSNSLQYSYVDVLADDVVADDVELVAYHSDEI